MQKEGKKKRGLEKLKKAIDVMGKRNIKRRREEQAEGFEHTKRERENQENGGN